jgi:hypothetical protein
LALRARERINCVVMKRAELGNTLNLFAYKKQELDDLLGCELD